MLNYSQNADYEVKEEKQNTQNIKKTMNFICLTIILIMKIISMQGPLFVKTFYSKLI